MTVPAPLPPRPPELPTRLERAEADDAFRDRRLEARELHGADLEGRTLHGLRLRECRLRRVDLGSAFAAGLDAADVVVDTGSWANLGASEATISRLEATGLRGTGVTLTESSLTHRLQFRGLPARPGAVPARAARARCVPRLPARRGRLLRRLLPLRPLSVLRPQRRKRRGGDFRALRGALL